MIAWSPTYPRFKRPLGYLRLLRARSRFYKYLRFGWGGKYGVRMVQTPGDQERLEALRDIHKGRRAFILGTGPSLTTADVKRLKNEVTFGCNGLYKIYPELEKPLTYHTVIDRTQLEDRAADLNCLSGTTLLIPLFAAYCIRRRPNVIYFPLRWPKGDVYGYPLFSEDAAAAVWDGMTVTISNLQLAFHMGCREAILMGIDFSYNLSQKIDGQSDTVTGVNQSPDHFIADYYTGQKRFVQFYPELQRKAYALARQVYERHGGRVVNASRQTKLDVFERVEFDSLFPN